MPTRSRPVLRRPFVNRHVRSLASILFICSCLFAPAPAPAQTAATPRPSSDRAPTLEPGKPIEGEVKSGETHSYRITLAANQFLHVVVEQQGIDVAVTLSAPDGATLAEVDSPNADFNRGPELISFVAETPGDYGLHVRPLSGKATGRYEVAIEELRAAEPQDAARVEAQRLFAEAQKLRDRETEANTRAAALKLEEAAALWRATERRREEALAVTSLGATRSGLGEKQAALDFYRQALPLWQAVGDKIEETLVTNNIGAVYKSLGDDQNALRFFLQALPVARAAGSREMEARTLSNIGAAYATLGDSQKALEFASRALPLRRTLGDRRGEAATLAVIAHLHESRGEKQQALNLFNESLTISRALKSAGDEGLMLGRIAALHRSLGEPEKALGIYDQALTIWRTIGDRGGEAGTLYGMAYTDAGRGDLARALARVEQALGIIESLRLTITNQALRTSFLAKTQQFYGFQIDVLMRLHEQDAAKGYDARALQAAERARARGLLDLLAEARADIRRGVDPNLLERERALQARVAAAAERQTRLLRSSHTKEQAEAAAYEVETLTTEYEELRARVRQSSPRYAALTQPAPLGLREVQSSLLDPDTLLLEYALGDERSYMWAVTSDSLTSYELPKRVEIEAAARAYYELLTARNELKPGENEEQRRARVAAAEAELPRVAAGLSRMVLLPAAARLNKRRVIVVADGALQYVPFGALPDPASSASAPLIAGREVVSLPSASVLASLRGEHRAEGDATKLRSVAVLADPVFDAADARVAAAKSAPGSKRTEVAAARPAELTRAFDGAGLAREGADIPRLPFSRREAEAISAVAPADRVMKRLDFRASRAAATSGELKNFQIVHFATHGLLNSQHPELSGVVLSLVDEQGKPTDGFLRLNDIYNLDLPAELVVLSACQTALGKEIRGEGLVGLTRGFMYAGARRVVASLWKVDDAATSELMRRFYAGMLKDDLTPAAALRRAQSEMAAGRAGKRFTSPYYWAAFVLQGEPR